MLPLTTDERLARSVAHGNDDAFALLYKRYEPTLFGYCRSITRNYDDACDALQNVSMKALVSLRGTERTAPVRPWLFRIAHNESINVLRRRSTLAPLEADSQRAADSAPGADEQYATRERIDEIVSDLRELPTGQRAAIVLRELAELDYSEIAVALDINENNARQLVFAARTSLKDSRSGRGLPCESVRDHITSAEGRRLRRRILRAHLQTCEPCREFAAGRRRARPRRAGALGLFSPAPFFAALFDGASSVMGSVALKGATALAVATAGLGAAGVAPEITRPRAEAAPERAEKAPVKTAAKQVKEEESPAQIVAAAPAEPAQAERPAAATPADKKAPAKSSEAEEKRAKAEVQETARSPFLHADEPRPGGRDGARPEQRQPQPAAPSDHTADAHADPAPNGGRNARPDSETPPQRGQQAGSQPPRPHGGAPQQQPSSSP